MSEELSVGTSLRSGWFVFCLVIVVALGIGGLVARVYEATEIARVLWMIGCGGAIGVALWAWHLMTNWRTLVIEPTGFLINDRSGPRRFRDEQVRSIALFSKTNFSEGVPATFTQTLSLWVEQPDGRFGRLDLQIDHAAAAENPFGTLEQRLAARLVESARAMLATGAAVVGEGFRLDAAVLRVTRAGAVCELPVDEIAEVAVFDDELCIWRRGDDEPGIRLPVRAMNALLLERLLRERLPADVPEEETPPGRLGRVWFERRTSTGWVVFWSVIAVGCGVGAGVAFNEAETFAAGALLCGVAVAGLIAVWLRRWRFRCHQFGVANRGLLTEDQLMYRDISTFTYGVTRMYYNGAYTGTMITMSFTPIPGPGRVAISLNTTLPHLDPELENLRLHIGRVVAVRMLAELQAGRPVDWTPQLRYLPDFSLVFTASGVLWGKHEPVTVPLAEVSGFELQEGTLHVWRLGAKESVIQESTTAVNFWPGFMLLTMVLAPSGGDRPGPEAAGDDDSGAAAADGEERR